MQPPLYIGGLAVTRRVLACSIIIITCFAGDFETALSKKHSELECTGGRTNKDLDWLIRLDTCILYNLVYSMLSHLSGCALLVKHADGHRLRVQCLAQVETIHSQEAILFPKSARDPLASWWGACSWQKRCLVNCFWTFNSTKRFFGSDCTEDEDFPSLTLRLDLISPMKGRIDFIRN